MGVVQVKVHARKPDGMRRAGQHWPAETVEREVDSATADILESEPLLDVCRMHNGKWVRSSRALPAPAKTEPTIADALSAKIEENARLRATNIELAAQLDRVRTELSDAHAEINALSAQLEAVAKADEIEAAQDAAKAKTSKR